MLHQKSFRVTSPYSLEVPGRKYKFLCKRGKKKKKFVSRLSLYICQHRGRKFKLQRAPSRHVATNESDWLIYERAFYSFVTSQRKVSVEKQKSLDSAVICRREKKFAK